MNDDITSREIELVDAILMALMENSNAYRFPSPDPDEQAYLQIHGEGYAMGYQTAQDIVAEVLRHRGFDIEEIEMESYE